MIKSFCVWEPLDLSPFATLYAKEMIVAINLEPAPVFWEVFLIPPLRQAVMIGFIESLE